MISPASCPELAAVAGIVWEQLWSADPDRFHCGFFLVAVVIVVVYVCFVGFVSLDKKSAACLV